jgi:ParB-like chromosome segregation protein Spo0J
VPIEQIIPNPRNPNRHPAKQVDALARVIKDQGWRAPITVSTRSGFIVRGHGRFAAALHLGAPEVPVDFQDYANEAAEYADMIADNRLAEMAKIDERALRELLGEMKGLGEIDLELTGYAGDDLARLLEDMGGEALDLDDALAAGDPGAEPPAAPEPKRATYHCPKCGFEFGVDK